MTVSEKVAYLKGLAEGLNIDTDKSKEGKLITVIIGILEEIGMSIEDLEENNQALGETIDALSDDLADVESVVYEESDDDEDEDDYSSYDDDWYQTECPNCGATIFVGQEDLKAGSVKCPSCDTLYGLDVDEGDDEDDEDENGETPEE